MSKTNKILMAVLVLQAVLLAARVLWPESSEKGLAAGGALVTAFNPAAVTQITVEDNDGKKILLKKVDDRWLLPDYADYPVESARVTKLLDMVKQVRADRLITQSETSFRRLQVSPDDFMRRLTIEQSGGETIKLYLGKIGGGSTTHVRLDGQNQVYLASGPTAQDANAQPSSWINTLYFSASSTDVVGLTLQNANGTFEFTKEGDAWTVSGLKESEVLNQNNFTSMLTTLTSLRMTEPVSKEASDDFGLDAPQAVITLRVMEAETPAADASPTPDTPNLLSLMPDSTATPAPTATPQKVEKEYTFQIGAALSNGVVLKGSNSEYYVLVSRTTAERFTTKTQADFATVPPTPTPGPTDTPEPPAATPTSR